MNENPLFLYEKCNTKGDIQTSQPTISNKRCKILLLMTHYIAVTSIKKAPYWIRLHATNSHDNYNKIIIKQPLPHPIWTYGGLRKEIDITWLTWFPVQCFACGLHKIFANIIFSFQFNFSLISISLVPVYTRSVYEKCYCKTVFL